MAAGAGRHVVQADVPEARADLLSALAARILVVGRSIVSTRLTSAAYSNGLALALPQVVMARPEGSGHTPPTIVMRGWRSSSRHCWRHSQSRRGALDGQRWSGERSRTGDDAGERWTASGRATGRCQPGVDPPEGPVRAYPVEAGSVALPSLERSCRKSVSNRADPVDSESWCTHTAPRVHYRCTAR